MRTLAGLYLLISHALGAQRRLIRRVAALCLVFMGVHLAADHLDDLLYGVIDAIDLIVDNTVAGFLDWLAQAGGMSTEAALKASSSFATFVDLPEKDKLALTIGLGCELLLDLLLFELAWGRFVDDNPASMLGELAASGRQMLEALSPLDLERLAVIPTLLCYAFGGAATAALAMEGVARSIIEKAAPDFLWAGHLAAAAGILAAALLIWRFMPDLLHGALLRSRARHDRARDRFLEKLKLPRRFPRIAKVVVLLRLHTRGTWLCVLALPLAVAGLMSHDLTGLLDRVQVIP